MSHAAPRHGQPQWDEQSGQGDSGQHYTPAVQDSYAHAMPAPRSAYEDAPAARDAWAPVPPTAPQRTFAPRMTPAGSFFYVLGCIAMGGMYLAKVPAKKALQDAGLGTMTSAEQFWYVLGCIPFGAFYFAKLPMAKALTEVAGRL
jgi:hypothetical protein